MEKSSQKNNLEKYVCDVQISVFKFTFKLNITNQTNLNKFLCEKKTALGPRQTFFFLIFIIIFIYTIVLFCIIFLFFFFFSLFFYVFIACE